CLVARRQEPFVPFAAALKGIAQADIELFHILRELAGVEEWDELAITTQNWIGPQIGRDFLGLVLLDLRARGLESRAVGQGQADGLIQRDHIGWGRRRHRALLSAGRRSLT